MLSRWIAPLVSAAFFSFAASEIAIGQSAKIPVTSEAALPSFTYPLAGSATQLLSSDAATFQAFASKVLVDINATFDAYDIRDHATLSDLLEEKLFILALLGKDADALALIPQIRAVQDKPAARATIDLQMEAILRARLATKREAGDAFLDAYKDTYGELVRALPYATAGAALQEDKVHLEIRSPATMLAIASHLDNISEKTHALSEHDAYLLIILRYSDEIEYPTKAPTLAVLTSYLATQAPAKKPNV